MSETETGLDRRIGDRIRALRDERGLTLDALAREAAVSRAMLSRIERGESSPTAQLLARVCGGLNVTLSALFAEAEAPSRPLARRAEQPLWRDPETRYVRRTVSPPGTGSGVDVAEIEFPAGRSVTFDNRRISGRDQHVWVLDGILEVTVGEETFRLETGDCLHMRFGRETTFRNPARKTVRYAVIVGRESAKP
jgi:transcriptional regulator with XRE-family HTH domain